MLGLHRDQREQPQRLDVLRVALQDLAVDALGLLELSRAVAARRPCASSSRAGIGAQEGLHDRFGLVRAAGLRQRVHQGELRGLQLRVERDRLAQQADRFVDAAQLQQRAAELLVALGVLRQLDERAPQQRLRLGAAALAVERGAEERQSGSARPGLSASASRQSCSAIAPSPARRNVSARSKAARTSRMSVIAA